MLQEYRPSDIVLVRHGESLWNAWTRGRDAAPPAMRGVPNHLTPLTPEGIRQAEETGDLLAREFPEFAVLYHSPYIRTTRTAYAIAARLPYAVKLYRDLLLVEQQFGWLDAGIFPDTKEFERLHETYRKLRARVGKFYAKPPNGESWFDVSLRTHDFLAKLFRPEWDKRPIGVVSHAVTIATFLYHLAGRDEEEILRLYQEDELGNCGIVHFRHCPGNHPRWELVCWNRTA